MIFFSRLSVILAVLWIVVSFLSAAHAAWWIYCNTWNTEVYIVYIWIKYIPTFNTKLLLAVAVLSCRNPRGWIMPRGRPQASWLRQMEFYIKTTGIAGLASGWAMARRRPKDQVARWTRQRVCPHTWPWPDFLASVETTEILGFLWLWCSIARLRNGHSSSGIWNPKNEKIIPNSTDQVQNNLKHMFIISKNQGYHMGSSFTANTQHLMRKYTLSW